MMCDFASFTIKRGWIDQNKSQQLTSVCIWNLTMTENVSFDEQKHRILINSNVREDGTLIHDKNKVDFTISSNQISDNNINNVGTSKSFLRTDSTYLILNYLILILNRPFSFEPMINKVILKFNNSVLVQKNFYSMYSNFIV